MRVAEGLRTSVSKSLFKKRIRRLNPADCAEDTQDSVVERKKGTGSHGGTLLAILCVLNYLLPSRLALLLDTDMPGRKSEADDCRKSPSIWPKSSAAVTSTHTLKSWPSSTTKDGHHNLCRMGFCNIVPPLHMPSYTCVAHTDRLHRSPQDLFWSWGDVSLSNFSSLRQRTKIT